MDLSLTSLCDGSNNVQELLMDISFPLFSVSSCVGSGSSSGGISRGIGSVSGLSVGSGISQWHLLVVASVAGGGGGVAAVALALAVAALVVAAAAVAAALAEVVYVVAVALVAALTTALVVEAAVLLLSLLTLHLTLIQIQTMNSLMHYLIPIVLNVKLNIWCLNLIILI